MQQVWDPLFSRAERWGWQFVPVDSKEGPGPKPDWEEPPPLRIGPLEEELRSAKGKAMQALPKVGMVLLVGLGAYRVFDLPSVVAIALVAGGLGALGFGYAQVHEARQMISGERQQWTSDRNEKWEEYQRRVRDWEDVVHRHKTHEQQRATSQPLWYPISPRRPPHRVDVCGGTTDGWASLLTTAGTSLLGKGSKILLVDLSGDDVGAELRPLATDSGYRTVVTRMRCSGSGPDVFTGLGSDDVVDALALSIRESADNAEERLGESHALDTEVVRLAITCLDPPYSIGQIVAGLTYLARPQDVGAAAQLTESELQRLATKTDVLANDQELRRRLSVVLACLRPLDGMRVDDAPQALIGDEGACDLECVVLEHGTQTQTMVVQRLLINLITMRLKSMEGGDLVVVVAGADQASHLTLELLSRHAWRAGVRLVVMFEHLRGAVKRVIGGDGSATVLMRLGNTDEAAAAAEYVGREHKFVLSQITHTLGETLTDTAGTSETRQEGISNTDGDTRGSSSQYGNWWSYGRNKSRSRSVTTSRSDAWGKTRSFSEALSDQTGETTQRSYDFTIEPTQFQSLPLTAFVAVARNGVDQLVVAGDCNPGIVDLDRVALDPFER